ncbi:DUF2164 domain-containing protein [Brevundimonas sp. DC300-4]|uniref:DUF2164 domain-containing protein n=1 Tax=Brevundimonas sp. DC300-4 TaxID=2804594 RepID=UPI003CE94F47
MKPIVFSKEEQRDLIPRIKAFVRDELDLEIGDLQASLLMDFFANTLGHAVYNRAVYDAQALIATRAEEMAEALYALERKP